MLNFYRCLLCFMLIGISANANVDSNVIYRYYKHIYSAEGNILNNRYKQASVDYDSAFHLGFTPFATDVYNNMLIAIDAQDNQRIFEMAKILLQKGANIDYFKKSIFNSFRKSTQWKELQSLYVKNKSMYASRIDKSLIKQLDGMSEKDQELTHKLYKDPESKALRSSFDSLYARFRDLMVNNDYLSEDKAGVETNDTEISFERNYHTIFTHSFEDTHLNKKEPSILFDVLITAIHYGKVKAAYGHELFYESSLIKYRNDFYIMHDTLFQENRDNIVTKNPKPNLSSSGPTKEELSLMNYLHVDTYENILLKSRYFFQNLICKFINRKAIDDRHFFNFGTGQGRFFESESRNEQQKRDKVIEVCH